MSDEKLSSQKNCLKFILLINKSIIACTQIRYSQMAIIYIIQASMPAKWLSKVLSLL